MSTIRRVDASKYRYDDPRRYITLKDCLSEPEVLKAYCVEHPTAVCLGGYGFFGCCPEGKKSNEFIKYDLQKHCFIKADGKIIQSGQTYCERKIPSRVWHGKKYLENQIWNKSGLGHPDLLDGNTIIEAKGGLPSSQKAHTALGQLLFYREHEPDLQLGFLFPKIWQEAENLQRHFDVFMKYGVTILPV